ncbi:MAG TPA: hypothetical protein VNR18_07250 [Hyphomicrobiales bacterium]|nr:hypothetical protein [Hyphomicrobiales bacterium]
MPMRLTKLIFAACVVLLLGAVAAYFYLNQQTRRVVDERLDALVQSGRYEELSYADLQLTPGGDLHFTDLRMVQNGNTAVIGSLRVSDFDFQHDTPWHMDIQIDDLRFPDGLPATLTDSMTPATSTLVTDLMQDDTLPLSLHYRYRYTPEDRDHLESEFDAALPQAFTFSLDTTTRGIPLDVFGDSDLASADPMASMSRLSNIMAQGELPNTRLTLTDQGLLDRVVESAGRDNNVSGEDFRTYLITQARNFYLFAPDGVQDDARNIGEQLASFFEGGKTLRVQLQPEFDGSLARLQPQIMGAVLSGDFKQALDLVNLTVETVTEGPL